MIDFIFFRFVQIYPAENNTILVRKKSRLGCTFIYSAEGDFEDRCPMYLLEREREMRATS